MSAAANSKSSIRPEPSTRRETPDVLKAKDILRGRAATAQEMFDLAKLLKKRQRERLPDDGARLCARGLVAVPPD